MLYTPTLTRVVPIIMQASQSDCDDNKWLYLYSVDPPPYDKGGQVAPVTGQFEGGARFDKTTQPTIPVSYIDSSLLIQVKVKNELYKLKCICWLMPTWSTWPVSMAMRQDTDLAHKHGHGDRILTWPVSMSMETGDVHGDRSTVPNFKRVEEVLDYV